MTKKDLSWKLARRLGKQDEEAKAFVEAFMDLVKDAVAKGEEVHLRGFGSFAPVRRKAKKVRHGVGMGTMVVLPARRVPVFKPSDKFKALVEHAPELQTAH